MEPLLNGFLIVFQPINILMMLIGMVLGILVGILPGIGGAMCIALLIPFTFQTAPIRGILIMVTLYVTATYGGSITSILFKIPGEPSNIVTTLDGYELNKKGEAGRALGIAIFSSCLGGIFSTVVLILVSPQLAAIALRFGDAEYFALAVLGLSVCTAIGGGSAIKKALSAMLGLFFATWGFGEVSGAPRFTFGISALLMGIGIVPASIGLFAIGEVFEQVEKMLKKGHDKGKIAQKKVKIGFPPLKDILRLKWLYLRSAVLGTFIGTLPGVGSTTASFLGYSEAMRWSKEPEKFGTGIIEGVAAPETANNAASVGAMVPLITLGIPGSVVTAMMMGAFMIHGIRPGPMMIVQQADLVYAIFAGLLLSNLLVILGGLIGIKFMVRILDVSYPKIGAGILLFSVIGSYALKNSMADVYIAFSFGVLSFFMRRFGFGAAPMVLGLVLGPFCETSFQRAMLIANYNFLSLFKRPVCGLLLMVAFISFFYPWIRQWMSWRKRAKTSHARS